jgi:hypothetical protein
MRRLVSLFLGLGAVGAYCPAGPSSTADTNLGLLRFVGRNVIQYTPACPGTLGVEDKSSLKWLVAQGNSYASTITMASCGLGFYTSKGGIWIDFDQDNTFEHPSENVANWSSGNSPQTFNPPIAIPASAKSGTTRMRVLHAEIGTATPCATFTFGAAVDFSVGIGTGSEGGTSGGTVFLIILMVVVPLYIIGGCIYMRHQRGTVTMKESCPHYECWSVIPGLMKDGCIFTAKKLKAWYKILAGHPTGGHIDYNEV